MKLPPTALSPPVSHGNLFRIVTVNSFLAAPGSFLALPPSRFQWLEIASVCGWAEQDIHSWDNRGSAPGPEVAKILRGPGEQEIIQL